MNPRKNTLAIGDGANDVNMINEAHIGKIFIKKILKSLYIS
jgi:magnesium-transporting ATPase (P-type)